MRFNKVTLFLLVGILAGAAGCRKEHQYAEASTHKTDASYGESRSSIKASASPVSPEERDVQNNLKKIADWRSYLEASKGNTHIASRISRGINFISDPVRRMECFNRFFEIAFSYPIDAADPGTRSDQLFAFYEVSRMVAGSAEARYDEDNLWEVNLRRLKRLQQEMLRVQAFFDGKDKLGTFKGKTDEWKDYRDYVKRKYDGLDDSFSHIFGTSQTADFLSYERWLSIWIQLETTLCHEVEVWDIVIRGWKEKLKVDPISDKRKRMAEYNNDELKQALRECARQVELEEERRRVGSDVKVDVGDL